ncbi:MAG: CAP domain-containing protein, partial [Actinomycetaceae bacterium]
MFAPPRGRHARHRTLAPRVATALLTVAAATSVATTAQATEAPTGVRTVTPAIRTDAGWQNQVANAIAAQTNAYRAANGLSQLTRSGSIDSVAQEWSNHQASIGSMVHRGDYGRSAVPAGSSSTSEILSWGIYPDHQADYFMSQWRNSPVHNNILLTGSYTHYGVGVAVSADGRVFATQNFATYAGGGPGGSTPAPAAPAPAEPAPAEPEVDPQ